MKLFYTLAFLATVGLSANGQTWNMQLVNLGGNMVEVQIQQTTGSRPACAEVWGTWSFALSWDTVRVADVTPVNSSGCGVGLTFDELSDVSSLGVTAPGRVGRLFNCTTFNPLPNIFPFEIPQGPDAWASAGTFMITPTGESDSPVNLLKIVGPAEVANSTNSNITTQWLPNAIIVDPFAIPTINITSGALPLSLLSFDANKKGNQSVSMEWTTTNEKNVSHFVIERSRDGKEWEDIGSVQAAGETTSETTYYFTDKNVYNGRTAIARFYYRLRILDNDASESRSGVEAIVFRGSGPGSEVYAYPNPSSIGLNVEFNAENRIPSRMELFDATGKIVYSTVLPKGTEIEYIDYSRLSITSGTYILRVLDENEEAISTDKIIVSR